MTFLLDVTAKVSVVLSRGADYCILLRKSSAAVRHRVPRLGYRLLW